MSKQAFRKAMRRLHVVSLNEQDWMQRFHSIARQYGIDTKLPRDPFAMGRLVGVPDDQLKVGLEFRKLEQYVEAWAARSAMTKAGSTKSPQYMPAAWFNCEFGIPSTRLRTAARRKQLPKIGDGRRSQYHVATARRLWPDDMDDAKRDNA